MADRLWPNAAVQDHGMKGSSRCEAVVNFRQRLLLTFANLLGCFNCNQTSRAALIAYCF
ncbi:hypothetical protein LINBF2_08970 [Limnohabitans sp. INBF002]|nr:hypothetical protein LINBF2_08970 [Limnohabitans sp. INBF002]